MPEKIVAQNRKALHDYEILRRVEAGIALYQSSKFCAAINRHVLADPADWHNPAAFYKAEPCNWYSKFLHEHSIGHKAYGFCYDDASEQAAFFSGKGRELIVTLYWDSEPTPKPDRK